MNVNLQTPISDYGLIGDGRTAALISNKGSLDWCCFPRFDSPSYFSAILDPERGGAFSLTPAVPFEARQRYIENTNVLETTFTTEGGVAQLLDFFSITSEEVKRRRLWPDHEILRIIKGVEGNVPIKMLYSPRPGFGMKPVRFKDRGRFGISCTCDEHLLLLQTRLNHERLDCDLNEDAATVSAQFVVVRGAQAQFSLVYTDEAPAVIPALGDSAVERLDGTIRYWRSWLGQCQYDGLYSNEVRRSALALKLMIFAPSGAVVAAPTTSLPEKIGGERNWDYRYCWLRDASFTVRALVELGFLEEASAFGSWMLNSTRLTRPRLQVLYSVYGEATLRERILNWLSGYRNSKPVRIGNAAHNQFQLDVYGEVLDGVFCCLPFLKTMDRETREFILNIGRAVCELWDSPDDGIWEVRSGRVHHTHSKVLAWTALDRLTKICRHFGWQAPVDKYQSTASRVREQIEAHGFNSALGSYTRELDGNELDASVLVMPLLGYCEASSPRMASTCEAICRKLSKNGLIYRYLGVDDGLSGNEGSFGICNFWMAENLAKAGRLEDAGRWFDALISKSNSVGLWSEEIDPDSGEFLGNYPQAFTHIGLINAALTLSRAAEEVKAA